EAALTRGIIAHQIQPGQPPCMARHQRGVNTFSLPSQEQLLRQVIVSQPCRVINRYRPILAKSSEIERAVERVATKTLFERLAAQFNHAFTEKGNLKLAGTHTRSAR